MSHHNSAAIDKPSAIRNQELDHFNLQEDMENYLRHKWSGCNIRMKRDAVPHIFDCQPQRNKIMHSNTPRSAVQKLNSKRTLADIFDDSTNAKENFNNRGDDALSSRKIACQAPILTENPSFQNVEEHQEPGNNCILEEIHGENLEVNEMKRRRVTNRPHFKSKYIQNTPVVKSVAVNTIRTGSPVKIRTIDRGSSPLKSKVGQSHLVISDNKTSTSSSSSHQTVQTSFSQGTNISSEFDLSKIDDYIEEEDLERRRLSKVLINYYISSKPIIYVRIPEC